MKKKFIIAGITCGFVLITGICYSCTYQDNNASTVQLSTQMGEGNNTANLDSKEINSDVPNLVNGNLDEHNSDGSITDIARADTQISQESLLYVHICGEVEAPGVYQVNTGARLFDLIKLAGGLSENAAGDFINQAQQVTDGQRIYISSRDEVKELSTEKYIIGDQSSVLDRGEEVTTVNINTAEEEELKKLPGIGQAKAVSIIQYRKTNGKFNKIEDLMKIPGIKEGLFNQISSFIIVK